MFLLYNFILTVLSPIWVPWMLWRTSRREKKPNWKERTGDYAIEQAKGERRIWVHAVSVGETIAAKPILSAIRKKDPGLVIVLSVTTTSGHTAAQEQLQGLLDHLVYFPIDVARFQLAAMVRVQPKVVAIMETELWMNFLWAAKNLDATTMLINGRISDRSFPRARLLRFFYRSLLKRLDLALMQTEKDAQRIRALGAANVQVIGNCKFDQAAEEVEPDLGALRAELTLTHGKPVLVIGSTRGAGEEQLVLDAVAAIGLDRISVIHAPRHLERAEALAQAVHAKFGSIARRSRGEVGPYLVLDTYGELGRIYGVADIVVIGGGFGPYGGQNLIQPLAQGKPVLHGPNMANFREAADLASAAGCTIICQDALALAQAIGGLLEDPGKRAQMSDAARTFVARHLNASERYAEAIIAAANGAEKN